MNTRKRPLHQLHPSKKIAGQHEVRPLATGQRIGTSLPRVQQIEKSTAASAPKVYRPQIPKVLQAKVKNTSAQSARVVASPARAERTNATLQLRQAQPFASRVVQAMKIYPNLHPGAVEPVDPGNVFRLNSFANQYRLHRVNSHSVNVPNQQYNFVRTREGEMLMHPRYRHPSIAEGKQVLYAGEIFFNNGQLEWWSNGSGHYQPYAEDAGQANLPMDHFYSYQQVIKGEHKRKRS
jgi:hypothetical protein